jgi:16S rRNA pseudouridine516 synthase
VRLDKFLAYHGFGSRQQVKKLIKSKIVMVNHQLCTDDSMHVTEGDLVSVDHEVVTWIDKVFYMLNKPAGYVCANVDKLYPTVFELIHEFVPADCFVVGRLDVDTEGLVVIANDGLLAHQILNNKKHVPKVYEVHARLPFNDEMIKQLCNGVIIDNEVTLPAKVELINSKIIHLTITEGRFHQVKKMLIAVGNEVEYLKRLAINQLWLDENLKLKEYRQLSQAEIELLSKR